MNTLFSKILHSIGWTAVALLAIVAFIFALYGCEEQPQEVTEVIPQQTLPAKENFEEKIWTEDNFKQAEQQAELQGVNYLSQENHLPPPDDITEDDAIRIKHHTLQRLNELTAGATK